jgi:hypothetical protein
LATLFRNEAGWDRLLRVLLGLGMLGLGASGWLSQIGSVSLLIFGWVPLLTAIAGWCPIYSLLGVNTLRRARRRPSRSAGGASAKP